MPRVEDPRYLRGRGEYSTDISIANQTHLHVVRSPHAHANIVTIDISRAAAAPGVLAILTGKDLVADGIGNLPDGLNAKIAVRAAPRAALAFERVRCIGEPVVAIVAERLSDALDAAELVEVTYDVLAAAGAGEHSSPAALKRDGAIAFVVRRGDSEAVDKTLTRAHHVAKLDFKISRVTAVPLEPRAAVATYDAGRDRYTLAAGTHAPHNLRALLATHIFGIPEHKIRILTQDVGGSFGMKNAVYPEYVLALWIARKINRPVRWCCERGEAFLADEHARDNRSTVQLGLDHEGKFLALKLDMAIDVGAFANPRSAFPLMNIGGIAGVYTTPAIAVTACGVITNKQSTTPYRGSGRPEATYAIERIIDVAAHEMNIDRLELRRRNFIPPSAMPFTTALTFTYDSGDFPACFEKALDLAEWDGFETRRAQSAARGMLAGIGVANTIEVAAGPFDAPAPENAGVQFTPDGSAVVLVGTMSTGQGHETAYTQIVADRLGIAPADVRIVQGDTDIVAVGQGSGGSRTLSAGGSALAMTLDKVVDKATKIAAHLLEAQPDDVEFTDGRFGIVGTDRSIDFKSVAKAAFDPKKLPSGLEPGLTAEAGFAATAGNFPYGTHVCEVEIDPDTGTVVIKRYSVVDDLGRVINPMLAEGQIHGGIVQGVGQALCEELRFDDEGQLITASFMDYAMPRATTVPSLAVATQSHPTRTNRLGTKGAGEAGIVGPLAAVTNAVVNALEPFGIDHIDMPMTSERVWRALGLAKKRHDGLGKEQMRMAMRP